MKKQQQQVRIPQKKIYNNIDDALKDNVIPYKIFRKESDLPEYFESPIGLYDLYGENVNPFTGAPYKNIYKTNKELEYDNIIDADTGTPIKLEGNYKNLAFGWSKLKMYKNMNNLFDLIHQNQVVLLIAGTGVGKTVIAPRAILQYYNFRKKIILAVPKTILTVRNAMYTSACFDTVLGNEIGYMYKGTNKTNSNTKLTFITTGSLRSIITNKDPYLTDYSCVIIDEAHERSVDTDQLFLLMRNILKKRPDMKLIIMSATIDPKLFSNEFQKKGGFSYGQMILEGELTYPIKLTYEPKPLKTQEDEKKQCIEKLYEILTTTPNENNDILVFLKGKGGAQALIDGLMGKLKDKLDIVYPFCIALDGKSSKEDQDLATNPVLYKDKTKPPKDKLPNYDYTRKIVFATEVAESSLTIEGLGFVVDTCEANISAFLPLENASGLFPDKISKANADQRKGRVGRIGPGTCHRLMTESDYNNLLDYPVPEIQRKDLTMDILDLFSLQNIKTVADMRKYLNDFISPPKNTFIANAVNKLFLCGALKLEKSDIKYIQSGGAVIDLFTLIKNIENKNKNRKLKMVAPVKSKPKLVMDQEYQTELFDKLNEKNDGKLTDMGEVLKRFRDLSISDALTMCASYYYKCSNEISEILAIGKLIDYRMENLFEQYKPKGKNVDEETQKKERNILLNKQRRFYSKYGDHMTMLNVYTEFREYMGGRKGSYQSSQAAAQSIEGQAVTKKNPYEWCKMNGILHKLISKDFKKTKKWDAVEDAARQFRNTLMRALRPAKLKLKYYEDYVRIETEKGNKNIDSRERLLEEINKDVLIDSAGADEPVIMTEDIPFDFVQLEEQLGGAGAGAKNKEAQKNAKEMEEFFDNKWPRGGQRGGARRIPYEYNLFPNAYNKGKTEYNILYSLLVGNKINLAKYDKDKDSYRTLFPIKKSDAVISEFSTMRYIKAEYIIYSELIVKRKGQKVLTMNCCSSIDYFKDYLKESRGKDEK